MGHNEEGAPSSPRMPRSSCPASSPPLEEDLRSSCGLEVVKTRTLQSLWAGYGKAVEVTARRPDGEWVSLVVKQVEPPRGQDDDVGHQRKLRSYKVEAAFYRSVAPVLLTTDDGPAVAEPLLVRHDEARSATLLVLSDLRGRFPSSEGGLDLAHARAALSWLARLHATFFNRPLPEGLWEEGSFWHLQTRLDELDGVRREWPEVHAAAHRVDELLRGGPVRTCLHGDAKSANFLFGRDGGGEVVAAAYDFQYAGAGDPMRDVAYLLCSSTQGAVLRRHEEELLRHYHGQLMSRLPAEDAAVYPYEVMVERLDLALLDYARWMAGWGFWGNADWAQRRGRAMLEKIKAS